MSQTTRFTTSPVSSRPRPAGPAPSRFTTSPHPAHPAPPRQVVDLRSKQPGGLAFDVRCAVRASTRQALLRQFDGAGPPAEITLAYVGPTQPSQQVMAHMKPRLPVLSEAELKERYGDLDAKRYEPTARKLERHFAPVYWVTRSERGERVGVPAHVAGMVDGNGDDDGGDFWLLVDSASIESVALDATRCIPAPDGSVLYLLDQTPPDTRIVPLERGDRQLSFVDLLNLQGGTAMVVPDAEDGGLPVIVDSVELPKYPQSGPSRFETWTTVDPDDAKQSRRQNMRLAFYDSISLLGPDTARGGYRLVLRKNELQSSHSESGFIVPDPRPTPWKVIPALDASCRPGTFASMGSTAVHVVSHDAGTTQVFRDGREKDPRLQSACVEGVAPEYRSLEVDGHVITGYVYTLPTPAAPPRQALEGKGASFDTLCARAPAHATHVTHGGARFQLRATEIDEAGLCWVIVRGEPGSLQGTGVTEMQSSATGAGLADFRVPYFGADQRPFVIDPGS